MLERADAATYVAKANGRNQYQMFADAMLKQSQDRMSMDAALRHALVRDELFMHYQPLVSLTTGRVVGMESLLRWRHPKLGMLSPSIFIPLAEETGLIVEGGKGVRTEQLPYARTADEVKDWGRTNGEIELLDVVRHAQPTVLILSLIHI